MKLLKIKYKDNDMFQTTDSEGIEISFEINKKRTDNYWMVDNEYSRIVGILGKNASGKTTLVNILMSYFELSVAFEEKQNSIDLITGNSFWNSLLSASNNFYARNNTLQNTTKTAASSLSIYKKSPTFTATYEIDGKIYRHTVSITSGAHEIIKKEEFAELLNGRYLMIGRHDSYMFKSLTSLIFDRIRAFQRSSWKVSTFHKESTIDFNASLKTLQNNEHNKQLLLAAMVSADSTIKGMFYDENSRTMKFVMDTDKSTILEFNQLSSGTQKIGKIMTNIILSKHDKVIVIDEFQNYLNKSLLKDFIMFLIRIDKNTQYIITSNFPDFFNYDFRYDALYEIANIRGKIQLRRYTSGYKIRSDKKISSIFEDSFLSDPLLIESDVIGD